MKKGGVTLRALLLLAGASGIVTAWSGQAKALIFFSTGDFPGTMCRKVGTNGDFEVTTSGAVYNNADFGGTALTVDCPIAASAQDRNLYNDEVWYQDHSTSSINCTLRAEERDSTAVSQASVSSTGDDTTDRSMSFGTVTGFNLGHVHMRCTIPTRDASGNASYIFGYHADDDGVNDDVGNAGGHTLPGSTCRKVGTSGTVGITSDGTIYNDQASGGANLTIDCPIMTMFAGSTDDAGPTIAERSEIWYLDASPAAISCTYAAEDAGSTARNSISFNTTFDDNNYHRKLVTGESSVETFPGGYVHLRCTLPPRDTTGFASHIVGYGIEVDSP
jgi:hypothetical protein